MFISTLTNRGKVYTSDVKDDEWKIIKDLLDKMLAKSSPRGRPSKIDLREIYNAICYVLRNGCSWRNLPKDFPKWESVYYHFDKWRKLGIWRKINKILRRWLRKRNQRQESPSIAIVDTQSVKGTVHAGNGYDGGKKANGRKKHLLVDTMGFILMVLVTPANISDRKGLKEIMREIAGEYERLEKILADQGYSGEGMRKLIEEVYGVVMEIRSKSGKGFEVIPQRWVVERTFAWLGNYRRLSKDYETLIETSEMLIYMAMSDVMVRRLAGTSTPAFN